MKRNVRRGGPGVAPGHPGGGDLQRRRAGQLLDDLSGAAPARPAEPGGGRRHRPPPQTTWTLPARLARVVKGGGQPGGVGVWPPGLDPSGDGALEGLEVCEALRLGALAGGGQADAGVGVTDGSGGGCPSQQAVAAAFHGQGERCCRWLRPRARFPASCMIHLYDCICRGIESRSPALGQG